MKGQKSTQGQVTAAVIGGVVVLGCDFAGILPGESIASLGVVAGMVKAGIFGFLGAVGGLIVHDLARWIRAELDDRNDRN